MTDTQLSFTAGHKELTYYVRPSARVALISEPQNSNSSLVLWHSGIFHNKSEIGRTNAEPPNIIYLGGGWFTNIGNAFIDLGSIYSLRRAAPNCRIHYVSDFSRWLFYIAGINRAHVFNLEETINGSFLVLSGAIFSKEFIMVNGSVISKLVRKGLKLIVNGGGCVTYGENEIEYVRKFFIRHKAYALIARDRPTYENYHDLFEYSYCGVDCGFFVSDYYTPPRLDLPEYIVYNFDYRGNFFKVLILSMVEGISRVPKFLRNALLKTGGGCRRCRKCSLEKIGDKLVIRTHHSPLPFLYGYFAQPNTLISDNPLDYLTVYANTKATFSNRIHACVATLAYNNPAMLFSDSPRAALFDRVGATTIVEKPTRINSLKIQEEKDNHIRFLADIIKKHNV